MTWFNILFCVVFVIFFLKSFISWVVGDFSLDIDFDGESDIDVSGMLSFKGILHFLMGFSTVLTAVGYEHTHSFFVPYTFSIGTYILAVCFGILVMVGLFYLYQVMLKLNHYTTDNPILDNTIGKIYSVEDDGQYQVLINTPSGTFKKTAHSDTYMHKVGDEVIVNLDRDNNRYIFN